MKSGGVYILYIYVSTKEVIKMATTDYSTVDSRLAAMYADSVTTAPDNNYEDRSSLLFDHMKMIAFNNKMFLKL